MKYIIMIVLCCPFMLNAEAEQNAINTSSELNLSDNHQSFHYGHYPFYPLSHRGFYYPYYSYDPYGYYSYYSHSFCPYCGSHSCPMMTGKHKMMEHKIANDKHDMMMKNDEKKDIE